MTKQDEKPFVDILEDKEDKQKDTKQISTWLPSDFVDKFKDYVELLNQNRKPTRVTRITEKEIIFEALYEYMSIHPVE